MSQHSHQHANHHNCPSRTANEQRLGIAAVLTGTFLIAEVWGGIVSGSLALLADAGHMLTDFASLALAWYGFRLARRPANWKQTYGYDRFTILVAFANGLALFVIAAWIALEAWRRIDNPTNVLGGLMLWVALAGLVVNIVAFWILSRGNTNNLNMRAATLHVAGDLLGSLAAICAAIIILWTQWTPIDPILSIVVALIILRSAWYVVRDSAHILLEGAPTGIDTRLVAKKIEDAFPEVENVHHIHAWSITQERPMITMHIKTSQPIAPENLIRRVKSLLQTDYGITHATIETEFGECADGHTTTI